MVILNGFLDALLSCLSGITEAMFLDQGKLQLAMYLPFHSTLWLVFAFECRGLTYISRSSFLGCQFQESTGLWVHLHPHCYRHHAELRSEDQLKFYRNFINWSFMKSSANLLDLQPETIAELVTINWFTRKIILPFLLTESTDESYAHDGTCLADYCIHRRNTQPRKHSQKLNKRQNLLHQIPLMDNHCRNITQRKLLILNCRLLCREWKGWSLAVWFPLSPQ